MKKNDILFQLCKCTCHFTGPKGFCFSIMASMILSIVDGVGTEDWVVLGRQEYWKSKIYVYYMNIFLQSLHLFDVV